jgi:hypothetical protein
VSAEVEVVIDISVHSWLTLRNGRHSWIRRQAHS